MSPDQINDLRKRVLSNTPVTDAELAEAIKTLRAGRFAAATAATAAKTKRAAAAPVVDLDAALADLGL